MAGEVDAEEVEDFALVEVGGGPDGGDGVDVGVVAVERGRRGGCAASGVCERM